ncbi:putative Tic20 family protein [Microbacterium natoriense]|uniref:Tic20 family protein n=1 Tax=Microbacterium natoriense TaxID=284570 RepID=A0AAW8EU36_9MICO|nr:DUF4870 domain-containing protein [Microbacterium natoriense]MDQ0646821.1 putative Tic20 family protein [Microbacterium natoriense]
MSDAQYPQQPRSASAYEPTAPPAVPPGQSLPLAPLNPGHSAGPAPLHPAPAPGYPTAQGGYPAPSYPNAQGGYPAPGYPSAQGGYPAQGYPTPQGYPMAQGGYPISPGYPAYGYVVPSGRKFWGLQFLVFVPYVGALVTVIVSLVQRSSARRSPLPIVRENARWAANWALSFLLYVIVSYALIVIVGIATSISSYEESYGAYRSAPSGWIGIPVLLLLGIGVYCLVTMIRGCVVSDRAVHRPVLALPFLRD